MLVHKYLDENSLAAMLDAPEVNLRNGVTHIPLLSANKATHSGFESHRGNIHQKSKQGYQWPHKKDFCPAFFFKSWIITF